jgi:dihydroflavonol-4-reductase
VIAVNPSTLYGPGDVKLHTGEVFRNIASGRLRMAPPGGNGVVAVQDCSAGVAAALERGRAGERYILNSENLSFLEIFRVICELLGKPPIRKCYPRWAYGPLFAAAGLLELLFGAAKSSPPIDPGTIAISWRFRYYDSAKARRELGWSPRVPFVEACRQALAFYRAKGVIPR